MEIFLRCLQLLVKLLYSIVYKLLLILFPKRQAADFPPIRDEVLTLSIRQLIGLLQRRKLTVAYLVGMYIDRLEAVNPHVNGIMERNYQRALDEAHRQDEIIALKTDLELQQLWQQWPLFGMPCTIKESCAVKCMSFVVGSLQRQQHRCDSHGECVALLCEAGAIPLAVSVTPEYCFSIETNTYVRGRCLNPYDQRRTCGGSSGGEGALQGSGASLFSLGSDIAGSIRIPSLFNGIFGHKPTGGLVSVKGHFPYSSDEQFSNMLQIGPMTRFAEDLEVLLNVLAGPSVYKLKPLSPMSELKIYYSTAFSGLNGVLHSSVDGDIQGAIKKAVTYFQKAGIYTEEVELPFFADSLEISLISIAALKDFPSLMSFTEDNAVLPSVREYFKSIFGFSPYTKDGLLFDLMRHANAFTTRSRIEHYKTVACSIRSRLVRSLGSNGVLLFPTFSVPAIHHNSSHLALWSIDYTLIFNVLGLPATHVPMGLNRCGLPIGFQVIAAPYCDLQCFRLAKLLSNAFGGWTPVVPHQFEICR